MTADTPEPLGQRAERLAAAVDEVWADLSQQMGRASLEGHAVGQQLAVAQREKIEAVGRTLRELAAANAALELRLAGAQPRPNGCTPDAPR